MAFGLITLVWPDYKAWDQLRPLLNGAVGPVFVYASAAAWISGGTALQFRRTARMGAVVVGAVYLVFALLCVPRIIAMPQIYNSWGNFFEQFSLVTGAAIVYARFSPAWASEMGNRIGCMLVGICAASFALEQAFYPGPTASLVPTWLPPSQMFWAITTTVAFALAAVALLTNRLALLASRLLTMMIVVFGIFVWIPIVLSKPQSHANWSETAETFAIAGAAWLLADLLGEQSGRNRSPLARRAAPA